MSNIVDITDFSNPQLDIYARLNENQLRTYYEPNPGIFIAESPNVIQCPATTKKATRRSP